jgi:hypothetical protein
MQSDFVAFAFLALHCDESPSSGSRDARAKNFFAQAGDVVRVYGRAVSILTAGYKSERRSAAKQKSPILFRGRAFSFEDGLALRILERAHDAQDTHVQLFKRCAAS